jgi:hypothetical protein
VSDHRDLGEPLSAGQQDARTARAEALRRASSAAATLSGSVYMGRARLEALAALVRDLDRRTRPIGLDGEADRHDLDSSDT